METACITKKNSFLTGLRLSNLKTHPATFVLACSMFMTGACGLVAEYVLSTVSTYILGNSIEQFSIIIAMMLFMMGIGGWIQKFMSDEKLIEKFIYIEVSLALLCGFAPIAIYAAFGIMEVHFLFIQYFFVIVIGLLIGFEIPIVMRINNNYSDSLKSNIASVSFADYAGAFAGALVWAFILIRMFPITEIGFMVGGLNLTIAIMTFSYFLKKGLVKSKVRSILLILISGSALIFGYFNNRSWNMELEQRLYDDKIVLTKTTKYQHVVLTHNKQLDEHRLYINGNLQFSSIDEAIYHEQLVHPIMSLVPDHRRVLILGGGDGMALREVLKYGDVESVTLVDLDEEITALFSTDPLLKKLNNNAFADARVSLLKTGAVSDEGWKPIYQETGKEDEEGRSVVQKVASVQIYNLDADKFIQQVRGKWNVVIIDFPDPGSVELAKLYSKEFYMKLRKILAEKGMAVVQSTSPYHAKEAYLCIKRTIEEARFCTLPYHDNVPSFGDWGWIMFWKDNRVEYVVEEKIDNMSFQVETDYLTPAVFQKARVFGKGWLESEDIRISTLMHPVVLERYVYASWLIE